MLSNGIERLADRLVAVVGPVSGEDLVGSPAKQQLIAAAQQPPHRLARAGGMPVCMALIGDSFPLAVRQVAMR
jgi:hypothetical protein